ncbi:MAG: FAD-binding oxidoreductase [Rhodospirillaceae bacterium]|nr:FAD-binding oxidoreductase [Rhodospirillaceae bacterium]
MSELEGEVYFDSLSRGRYATDASMYQVFPLGVVVPKNAEDVSRSLQIAAEQDIAVLPRGGGTSQCGQTIGKALVLDGSKYLTSVRHFDKEKREIIVEPGIVLDHLNEFLKPHGLFFPVDVSTSSRATIGGMTGNNSVGARSIRYGLMVDNVKGVDALLADGEKIQLQQGVLNTRQGRVANIYTQMQSLYEREKEEMDRRLPKVLRNVAGYNLNRLGRPDSRLSDLLVGSEGTLAWFDSVCLELQKIPSHKVAGVCHFPTFSAAMESTKTLVELGPAAVELIDRTVIDLALENPEFNSAISTFMRGDTAALLIVEFAGENLDEQLQKLNRLEEVMGDLGYPGGVVRAEDESMQRSMWNVRKAALNIVMSMKGDGKPISFVEDCAVPLENLAEYTSRLTDVFSENGTTGTWYAHASVGCLHVRPILNLKTDLGLVQLRKIASAAHELVREFKGSWSGEHGDGIVRSEFIESMLGTQIANAFGEVKQCFDPNGRFNPGKIVDPPRMDDRSLTRFPIEYNPVARDDALDWSAWGGLYRATEMCNNNGTCRKFGSGVMCPSYRVTKDEQHLTRGRANALRLALTGQISPNAMTSSDMYKTFELCVSCKGCKRECPTGVDVARMKIEFLNQYHKKNGISLRTRMVAYLPRYAGLAARFSWLFNLQNISIFRGLRRRIFGLAPERTIPLWRRDIFKGVANHGPSKGSEVVLFADTFNRFFEPENLKAAVRVLQAAGYTVVTPTPTDGKRPLCCGRTFLSSGLVNEAKKEARRVLNTLMPYVKQGLPIVGLEPSCLLSLRDEFGAMFPGEDLEALEKQSMLFEEFLISEKEAGRLKLDLSALEESSALVHGHCHQKAFGLLSTVQKVLGWIPNLNVKTIESSCCGMAGAFGYEAEHYDTSIKMAELDLLPAIRAASDDTLVVADGTSCRCQIRDGSSREGLHVAKVLDAALTNHVN